MSEVQDDGILANPINSPHAIRLPAFEGPLDLLLFLVRKNEVDIYDIPIHDVTRQYLDVIRAMQELNLEVAGEFFVMASTLMQIKSSMLLPKDEQLANSDDEGEEDVDPRWQLVQQLIEYKRFKDAAIKLDDLARQQQDYLSRIYTSSKEEQEERPLKSVDKIELWNTFNLVLRRLAEQIVGSGEIQDEQISVSDRMEYVLDRIKLEKSFKFTSMFDGQATLVHFVSSFLALLELTRLKEIIIQQNASFTDILIERREKEVGESAEDVPVTSEFDDTPPSD